jgi:hypothetical protein
MTYFFTGLIIASENSVHCSNQKRLDAGIVIVLDFSGEKDVYGNRKSLEVVSLETASSSNCIFHNS